VEALFDFLELDAEADPIDFLLPGKTYLGDFSTEDQHRAARFVRGLAWCWALVKHHFERMLDSQSMSTVLLPIISRERGQTVICASLDCYVSSQE
jgi:hypothetical protein